MSPMLQPADCLDAAFVLEAEWDTYALAGVLRAYVAWHRVTAKHTDQNNAAQRAIPAVLRSRSASMRARNGLGSNWLHTACTLLLLLHGSTAAAAHLHFTGQNRYSATFWTCLCIVEAIVYGSVQKSVPFPACPQNSRTQRATAVQRDKIGNIVIFVM